MRSPAGWRGVDSGAKHAAMKLCDGTWLVVVKGICASVAEVLDYRYFMRCAESSLMPPLLMKLFFDRIERAPMPFFVKPVAKSIAGKVKAG